MRRRSLDLKRVYWTCIVRCTPRSGRPASSETRRRPWGIHHLRCRARPSICEREHPLSGDRSLPWREPRTSCGRRRRVRGRRCRVRGALLLARAVLRSTRAQRDRSGEAPRPTSGQRHTPEDGLRRSCDKRPSRRTNRRPRGGISTSLARDAAGRAGNLQSNPATARTHPHAAKLITGKGPTPSGLHQAFSAAFSPSFSSPRMR